jgi:hypothetical protein
MQVAWFQRGLKVVSAVSALVVCGLVPTPARAICEAPSTCICEEWPKAHVVRGTVRENSGTTSQVEVAEVFAGKGFEPVSPGDVIEGVLESASCGLSLGSFVPGDEVLALWQGTMPDPLECQEYVDCDEERCSAWGSSPAMFQSCRMECVEETRETCPGPVPRMVLVPWREKLELGEGRTLSSESVGILADRLRCNTVLASPPRPCNDVILHGVREGCSIGAVGSASDERQFSLIGWLFALAVSFGCMRARRGVPS